MYDKKKNLRDMLEGKTHEHIPVSFFQHFPAQDTLGTRCIDAHIDFYKETDFDFIKIMHDGLSAPIDLTAASLEVLKEYRPLLHESPYGKEYLKRAVGVNDKLKGDIDTYCNIFSPFTLFRRIEGKRWRQFFARDPRAVRDILLYMAEDIAWLCKKMIEEAGCTGIFLAFQGAEQGEFTPEEYAAYIAESDRRIISEAEQHSSCNILHFCAWDGIPNQLGLWKDYPGRVINWDTHVENLSLSQGRRYFGMRLCMGGFDNRRNGILYSGSRSDVEEETIRIIEEYWQSFGNTDGLMLGGDCSYLPDFETERFRWVTETVRRWEKEHK